MSNVGIGLAASIVAVVEAVVVVSAIEDSMVVVASAVAVVSGVSMASVLVLSSEIIEDIVAVGREETGNGPPFRISDVRTPIAIYSKVANCVEIGP